MAKEDLIEVEGKIIDVLTGGQYKVLLDNKHEITAYMSGKMRKFKIRIVKGDRVTVGITPYDLTKGLIRYRAK